MVLVVALAAAFFSLRWARYATSRRRMFREVAWITLEAEWEVEEP